jgi:hypothetical protein
LDFILSEVEGLRAKNMKNPVASLKKHIYYMNIKFVNHASYILSHENIHLITDPWIEGTAFNEGWNLIEPTKFRYSDFKNITHIWFSHEHPDHFSPSNLKSIPEEIRKTITILFQKTKDKKVINFCSQLGFKNCIELPQTWFELSSSFKILNIPHSDGDSWICMKAGEYTILNINDCVFENNNQILKIKNKINTPKIDILFTQFSYANWAGNKDDINTRQAFATKKLNEIKKQIFLLQPKYVIPFASYVWFCHFENFYMNDGINKIDAVYKYITETLFTKTVVLFPNEEWTLAEEHDSKLSIEKWMNSYNSNIKIENTVQPISINTYDLIKSGNEFIKNLKANNTRWMNLFLKPTHIFVEDHKTSYTLSLNGLNKTSIDIQNCDISLSSEAIKYCFKHPWGGATTRINGRYQVPTNGKFNNWKLYFQTSELNNHNEKFDLKFIITSIYRNLRRKFSTF